MGSRKILSKLLIAETILAAILLIAVAVVVGSRGPRSRTILVYMMGSNLESEYAAASLDITEMKGANFDNEHTKVLIYTGGAKKWALDEISEDENAIFEVKNGSIEKVKVYDKSLMTDPKNLVDFIDFAYEQYPGDLYDLILWDHGGGPIVGYGLDENSLFSAPMKIPVLTEALSKTKVITSGKKFDIIGFDACLMGSTEVAKALSKYSNYMIASEEVEPGRGWNYDFLSYLDEKTVGDTEGFGRNIIDSFIAHYDGYFYDVDLSLSMVDLRKVDGLISKMNELFSKVKDAINEETFSQFSRLMTREKVYGYTGRDSQSYDLVDLVDLCSSLDEKYKEEVDKIKSGFNELVVYNRSNIENTNGLSLYFLNFNKKEADSVLVSYEDVAFSKDYYDFLTKYKNYVVGERKVSRAIYKDLNETNNENEIKVELTDELINNYQDGEIIIFRKLGDNKFMPVYRSSEVELVGDELRATTYRLQFVVEATSGDETEYGWLTMVEKERTGDYVDYVTSGVLYYGDEFLPGNFEMYIRLPKGSDVGQIRDIRVSSGTDLSSKMSFDLDEIAGIEFIVGAYKLFNEFGELDYNMESHGTQYGIGVNLAAGDKYKIKLVDLDFDFGDMYGEEFSDLADYYAEFIVYDTQGDAHRLNLVHIEH